MGGWICAGNSPTNLAIQAIKTGNFDAAGFALLHAHNRTLAGEQKRLKIPDPAIEKFFQNSST